MASILGMKRNTVLNTLSKMPSDTEVNDACMLFNHSFGLMNKEDQDYLRGAAKEWLHAWKKVYLE